MSFGGDEGSVGDDDEPTAEGVLLRGGVCVVFDPARGRPVVGSGEGAREVVLGVTGGLDETGGGPGEGEPQGLLGLPKREHEAMRMLARRGKRQIRNSGDEKRSDIVRRRSMQEGMSVYTQTPGV